MTECVLSSSYHLHLWVLGYSHLQLFQESWDTMFLEISERITSHEYKEFTPLWSEVSIFHQSIVVWKTCQPTYVSSWHIKKKVSNIDHFSVMKLIRELSDSWGSSPQRQLQAARNAALCWVSSWGLDTVFQAGMILVKTQCPSPCYHLSPIRLYFIFPMIHMTVTLIIIELSLIIIETNRNFTLSTLFNDSVLGMSMK